MNHKASPDHLDCGRGFLLYGPGGVMALTPAARAIAAAALAGAALGLAIELLRAQRGSHA